MRKIVTFLMVMVIAALMAANSIAEEAAPAVEESTATEETYVDPSIMYTTGEAYVGILYTKSRQSLNGTRVIGDSGIGIKAGYFVYDNADVSLSYVFGTWTGVGNGAGANEIRLMGNYHYPFFNLSNIVIGGLIGVGYDSFSYQSTTVGGFTITPNNGAGFIYEAGFDGRMNSLEGYLVYRSGSVIYSAAGTSTNLTLSCVEAGVNYIFDTSSWFAGSGE